MFDPETQPPNTHLHPFNLFESINDTYTSLNLDAKPQRAAQNYETYKSWSSVGGLQFSPEKVDDESGVCSPPLWAKNSPPKSSIDAQNSDKKLNIISISPSSRVQAIARGQRELMEMVRAMPESSYELSLKDLVEHHSHRGVESQRVQNQEDYLAEYKSTDCLVELDESLSKKASVKRQESGKKLDKKGKILVRSGSNINENKGLFLKMVFPINLGGKKKKKKANPYAKVSPNTDGNKSIQNSEDNKGSKVLVEKEWWKRRSSNSDESGVSSNSGSTGSSGSSGSSVSSRSTRRSIISTRKKNGCLRGILPFHSKKSLSEK